MTDLIEPLQVVPGSAVRLSRDHDPGLDAINPGYPAADPAEREEMAGARAGLVAELGLAQPGRAAKDD